MATTIPRDAKLAGYLREYVLECSLCHAPFNDPRTLDCLHTFCKKCIADYMAPVQESGRFACPNCQCEQSIPIRGASGLTPSCFHACVQETSRLIDGGQVECTSCQTDKAQIACHTCGEVLCNVCVAKHDGLSSNQQHTVAPIGDLAKEENLVNFQRQRFALCKKHGEQKKMYCKREDVALCSVCVYEDNHKHHDVTSMQSKTEVTLEQLRYRTAVLNKDQEQHMRNVEVLKQKMEDIKLNQKEVITAIEAKAKHLHDMIDSLKAAMIDTVTSSPEQQLVELQRQIDRNEAQVAKKVQLTKECGILEEIPICEVQSAAKELIKKVNKCKPPHVVISNNLDASFPQFAFVENKEISNANMENGIAGLMGHLVPLKDSSLSEPQIIESDMKEHPKNSAILLFRDVINQFVTSPRGRGTYYGMAKAFLAKWRENHKNAEWRCSIGLPRQFARTGDGKENAKLVVVVEGVEMQLIKLDKK